MRPTARPVRRRPPAAAIVAAVLAVVSCAVPALLLLVVLAVAGPGGPAWIDYLLPFAVMCALVAGAVLLLLGRSWVALAVPAGLLAALVVAGRALGGWGGGPLLMLGFAAPALVVVLSALPGVRGWVAARRAERAGSASNRP